MDDIIIKTNKKIGKFLNNSFIDNIPLRQVTIEELNTLSADEYELINTKESFSTEEIERKYNITIL